MKNEIEKMIKDRDYVTFRELMQIEGFTGDQDVWHPEHANLILWTRVSVAAAAAIRELLQEKRVVLAPARPFSYAIDGGGLRLPIAKRIMDYKKPRWLPMLFRPAGVL